MKKFWLFCVCSILFSFKSYAIGPDLTPLSSVAAQFCAECTSEQLAAKASAIKAMKEVVENKNIKGVLDETKAHFEKYARGKGEEFLSKYKDKWKKKDSDEKPVSYARMIKQTKTRLDDVALVKETFKKYFLYIPSDDEEVQASYKEKREQFVEDTTLELYITAREMDKELTVMLAQLDVIEKCIILNDAEGCKAADMEEFNCQKDDGSEDEMCYRRNAVLVADIYDEIMKRNEYLMAMRAQYEAVRTLGQGVKPKPYSGKKQKTSKVSGYLTESNIYASQEIEDEELIVEEIPDSKFDFSENNQIDLKTPLDGKEADIKAMAVFHEVEDKLSAAFESHNLKQQLPEMKRVFDDYHSMEKMHLKASDNLQKSQTCVLNYLAQRYDNSQKVWLDNCMVDDKEGYVCAYSPAKSFSDNSESEGIYDVACPDNAAQKCYKLSSSAYNEVGGMSGWLINMYLNAKDELSDFEPKEENYIIKASTSEPEPDEEVGPNTDYRAAKDYKYQIENGEILADKYLEKMRVLGRLNTSVGALANEEINKDVNGVSGKSKFGVNTKPFPLWNDQMNFYNQYIDDKYENIKNYFLNASLFKEILGLGLKINETFEYEAERNADGIITKSVEAIRKEVAEEINGLIEAIGDDRDSKVEQIEAILAQEKVDLENITAEHNKKLAELEKKRVAAYKELEDVNIKQADLHAEIEKQNEVINYSEDYNEQAGFGADFDKQFQNPDNPHETLTDKYNRNIKEQSQKEQNAEIARNNAGDSLRNVNDSKKIILEKIKQIEAEINEVRADKVLAYYNAEQKYKSGLEDIVEDNTLSEIQQQVLSAVTKLTVLGEAEELIDYFREYAAKKAEEALEKLSKMKNNNADSLYYAQNNPKVVQIHTDMLKKITEPDVNDVIAELGLDDAAAALVVKYAESLTGLFSNVCDKVSCYQPDSRYFVGLIAQEKDLAAPKAPVDFSSAPLREIFSFGLADLNYIDYYASSDFKAGENNEIISSKITEATKNGANVLLVENSLLESGLELPEIWKLVLSYRPFVQKDLDLEKFLNHDKKESYALGRSGIYPCLSAGKIIDVVPDGKGNLQYAELSVAPAEYGTLPQCQAVAEDKNGYYDVSASEGFERISINPADTVSAIGASELGNILEYTNAKVGVFGVDGLPLADELGLSAKQKDIKFLSFRKELLTAMSFLVNYLDKFEEGEEIKFSAQYNMYNRVLPQSGQFADYLEKMDIERMALEAKDKMKNSLYSRNVDDLVFVNMLYKSFAAMGYDFDREKFDLSDETYYKQAENILNARKETNLREAKKLLEGGNMNLTFDEMISRREQLLKKIALLELDADEVVSITGDESIEELGEKIKTEKTDKAILDKERERGDKYVNEKIEHEEPVYCSVYVQ